MTILSSLIWFIVRAAWIENTSDKNKCFYACLVGTIFTFIFNRNYKA